MSPDPPDPDAPDDPDAPTGSDADGREAVATGGDRIDGADDPRVDRGRAADRPALRALQSLLPDPSPALLRGALSGVGWLLVSRRFAPASPDAGGGETDDLSGPARGSRLGSGPGSDGSRARAVGYLVAVPGESTVHLAELVVAPGHRREGRATGLVAAACSRARSAGADRATLLVAPDNRAARRCYRSAGFRVLERRPGALDGDPALAMVRPLRG